MHHQLVALSPTISLLDHQEVVETTSHLLEPIPLTTYAVEVPNNENLFSYELESNDATEMFFGASELEVPNDIEWGDLLPTTESSISLNDISPTFLSPPHESLVSEQSLSVEEDSPIAALHQTERIDGTFINRIQFVQNSTSHATASAYNLNLSEIRRYGGTTSGDSSSDMEFEEFNTIESVEMGKKRAFLNNEDLAAQKPGLRLSLSLEERQMLKASGLKLPSRFPLTTEQERALRSVRRKIRNKLSAQASRKKRQEYLFELERRISVSDKENKRLKRQVVELQNDKRDLVSHVRKLRSYIARLFNRAQERREAPSLLPRYRTPDQGEGDVVDTCLTGVLFPGARTDSKQGKENRRMTAAQAAAAGGGTSLLVAAFFILAWTALVPLPSYLRQYSGGLGNASGHLGFLANEGQQLSNLVKHNPLLSGHSRTLLQSSKGEPLPGVENEQSKELDRRSIDQSNPGNWFFDSVASLMTKSVSLMKTFTKRTEADQSTEAVDAANQSEAESRQILTVERSTADVPHPEPPRQLLGSGRVKVVVA